MFSPSSTRNRSAADPRQPSVQSGGLHEDKVRTASARDRLRRLSLTGPLSYAKVIAERFDASVHVIHVLEPPGVSGPWGSESHVAQLPRMREIAEREEQTRLEKEKPAGGSTEIADGNNIARTIMDLTRASEADLIVMGTHGRSGIAHALLGQLSKSASSEIHRVRY